MDHSATMRIGFAARTTVAIHANVFLLQVQLTLLVVVVLLDLVLVWLGLLIHSCYWFRSDDEARQL